jgi:hypothetical protein
MRTTGTAYWQQELDDWADDWTRFIANFQGPARVVIDYDDTSFTITVKRPGKPDATSEPYVLSDWDVKGHRHINEAERDMDYFLKNGEFPILGPDE